MYTFNDEMGGLDAGFGSLGTADVQSPGDVLDNKLTATDNNLGNAGAGGESSLLKSWATKAIGPIMAQIAGASMRPHNMPAPMGGAGHGVSANTGGYSQLVSGIGKAAGGDPLQGLSGFKNLL